MRLCISIMLSILLSCRDRRAKRERGVPQSAEYGRQRERQDVEVDKVSAPCFVH